jgi:xanthine dehydrogenase YagS FAD-binding subunit
MNSFDYVHASNSKEAAASLGKNWEDAKVIAGGVDLLGEMKDYLISPKKVVDLKTIPGLNKITIDQDGLHIGATTLLVEIEENSSIQKTWSAIAQAAGSVGTPQIRNMGTIGGNLCQRPRCWYYRDEHTVCLKKGGNMCYALDGENKYHAIFGDGLCHIVHPSDLAPALIALDAKIKIVSPTGSKELALKDFYSMPDKDPLVESVLKPNEIITEIIVPTPVPGTRSVYLKQKELGSHDFALVSAAVVLQMESGRCKKANVVLGGVAPIPWHSVEAEKVLEGKSVTESAAIQAAQAALANAKPMKQNGYKIPLAKTIIKRAVLSIAV